MANLTCPHCGTANRIGSNFCNKCGTDLREEEAPASTIDDAAPTAAIARAAEMAAEQMAASADEADENDVKDGEFTRNLEAETGEEAPPAPLPPLFDLGLASITSTHDDSLTLSQPWLRAPDDEMSMSDTQGAGSTRISDDQSSEESADDLLSQAGARLVAGVQGLLDPLNITSDPTQSAETNAILPTPVIDELSAQQIRYMRRIMSEEPVLAAQPLLPQGTHYPSLRIPWVFWLIGLAVMLPILGIVSEPVGSAREWPGVAQAYDVIESLPPEADVLVYWAYDPATSGELDLVAQPVIRHLLQQRANLTFVSLLPGGPATVRRLISSTLASQIDPADVPIAMHRITERNFYLTGGAVGLPLLANGPELLSTSTGDGATLIGATTPPVAPDLGVILAARAEDVQHWLELVQPVEAGLLRTTVVAVTGAGVDPMVRPYLDSGQLSGLVSGFDGAESYQRLLAEPVAESAQVAMRLQLLAQNWAHMALLFVLVMGNIAGFANRGRNQRDDDHG